MYLELCVYISTVARSYSFTPTVSSVFRSFLPRRRVQSHQILDQMSCSVVYATPRGQAHSRLKPKFCLSNVSVRCFTMPLNRVSGVLGRFGPAFAHRSSGRADQHKCPVTPSLRHLAPQTRGWEKWTSAAAAFGVRKYALPMAHYPRGVEAFVLDVGNIDEDCTHTKVRGRNLWRSFNDQHAWNATYGFEIPVLEMDLAAADPFRVPEDVPPMTFT